MLVHTGGQLSGKELYRKRPGGPGEQQGESKSVMYSCSKEGQQHCGLQLEEYHQQVKRGDPFP